jgi:4-hydroxybenzoate polyprenyltransferase
LNFDIYPATSAENQIAMANLFSILLDYAIFAFMINLLREMIKDIEDIKETINKK